MCYLFYYIHGYKTENVELKAQMYEQWNDSRFKSINQIKIVGLHVKATPNA